MCGGGGGYCENDNIKNRNHICLISSTHIGLSTLQMMGASVRLSAIAYSKIVHQTHSKTQGMVNLACNPLLPTLYGVNPAQKALSWV